VPKIIAVHSFRGGTGKSSFVASLAVLLARLGRRVGVVDTDIQSPGIHVLFGLGGHAPLKTLNDFLWGRCPIEQTALDVGPSLRTAAGGVAFPAERLYLIPSSTNAGEIARVLREGYDVRQLISGYRELVRRLRLDYLLIDTHPGLNEETLVSLAISDVLLLLLRPDRQDYQGTAVTLEVARMFDLPETRLVVNKVLPALDAASIRQQAAASYGVPIAAVLPLSEEMLLLGSAEIFSLRYPDHGWTAELARIAAELDRDQARPADQARLATSQAPARAEVGRSEGGPTP
jgi:MinD-like ATPase involved in chromosome partitioning or flagellar assembly